MGNALTLITLVLQSATQLQSYGATLQKAIAEGRDVTDAEKATALGELNAHLQVLQDALK